ncbi:MAG: 30S ribosomal protein S16 [Crocinitomicaceae bacterium]|nr:30S ribosomal protein S16 [Crocinitomicaceae bacterium]
MAVKLRLQRHGKKGKPFFHIVAADGRSPRDGKYIERIGSYNPNTNPATIVIDNDKALSWLQKGAQPSDTMRAILSYKGVLYRLHLHKGVLKGALTQEDADKKFEAWVAEKEGKIQGKRDQLSKNKEEAKSKALKAERAVNETRLKALASAAAEAAESAAKSAEVPTDTQVEEAPATEAPAAESSEA